ncbi:MAG: phospholipid carrier-dependent glycosyltransferase, partial [Moraxellaceae bacterium]
MPNETLFLGMRVSNWAWLLTLSALTAILYGVIAAGKKPSAVGRYLFGAFAIFLVFFVLGPKIHERYLFPAAFIGFAAFLIVRDKRILWLSIAATLTTFINTLVTLDFMLRLQTSLVPNENLFLIAFSFINVVLLIQTMRVGYSIFLRGDIQPLSNKITLAVPQYYETIQGEDHPIQEPNHPSSVSKTTWIILAGICVAYSATAFTYLGNFESPQKFWQPIKAADWAIFDFGEDKKVSKIQYHHGLGTGEYALSWSTNGHDWNTSQGIIVDDRFAQFNWRTLETNISARYLKVGLSNGSLQLNELALRDGSGELITTKKISGPEDASFLFDEQNKTTKTATALNSMYFDEIYHARSAWEILQGIDASENTHPPLGKIIISVGVKIFGMNPFGFRFMGVVFGILMLPIFFCLAHRLFRSDKFALIATALLALDFMHFTQTRIATIDTYGVFFIIASSYWMLRFLQTNPTIAQHFARVTFFADHREDLP